MALLAQLAKSVLGQMSRFDRGEIDVGRRRHAAMDLDALARRLSPPKDTECKLTPHWRPHRLMSNSFNRYHTRLHVGLIGARLLGVPVEPRKVPIHLMCQLALTLSPLSHSLPFWRCSNGTRQALDDPDDLAANSLFPLSNCLPLDAFQPACPT